MPAYDTSRLDPPGPIALVTVRSPSSKASVTDVPLLMDTGADVTILPAPLVGDLVIKTEAWTSYELEGFDGNKSLAEAVELELVFLRKVFRGQFILLDQDCGVMGRNVLNSIRLLLDGPILQWDEFRS